MLENTLKLHTHTHDTHGMKVWVGGGGGGAKSAEKRFPQFDGERLGKCWAGSVWWGKRKRYKCRFFFWVDFVLGSLSPPSFLSNLYNLKIKHYLYGYIYIYNIGWIQLLTRTISRQAHTKSFAPNTWKNAVFCLNGRKNRSRFYRRLSMYTGDASHPSLPFVTWLEVYVKYVSLIK